MCSASGFLPGSAMTVFWPNHICSKFKVLSRNEMWSMLCVCYGNVKYGPWWTMHSISLETLMDMWWAWYILSWETKLQSILATKETDFFSFREATNDARWRESEWVQSFQAIFAANKARWIHPIHETPWNDSPFLHDANTSCSSIIHPVSILHPNLELCHVQCLQFYGSTKSWKHFGKWVPVLYLQAYFRFKFQV